MDKGKIHYQIIEAALPIVPFDGWTDETMHAAAQGLNMDPMMVDALFPRGRHDYLKAFAAWADDKMREALTAENIHDLRVRDRVMNGVLTRLEILEPHKEAVRMASQILMRPQYARLATSLTWGTADKIWQWAGDESTDYNHYTKRGLLSAVIVPTTLYWLQDDSVSHEKTKAFLDRRIGEVLFLGKNGSKIIKPLAHLAGKFKVSRKWKEG